MRHHSDRPDIQVRDNPDAGRYEACRGGALAGIAEYSLRPGHIEFTHTEVGETFEGHGVGGRLVGEALDDARRRGLTVVPTCDFVRNYIREHTEYADLVA